MTRSKRCDVARGPDKPIVVREKAARVLLVIAVAPACGGSPAPAQTTVFDQAALVAGAVPVEGHSAVPLERAYPALDRETVAGEPHWIGVSILHDGVRFSRPNRWMIRDAGIDAGRSYITYVSPSGAYSFAIYERSDGPRDSWGDVLQRYENDVALAGAKVTGQRIPTATDTNQGRAYTIVRKITSEKLSLVSKSREILIRGEHRVVLVQVVAQDEGLDRLRDQILEVIKHIEVL